MIAGRQKFSIHDAGEQPSGTISPSWCWKEVGFQVCAHKVCENGMKWKCSDVPM